MDAGVELRRMSAEVLGKLGETEIAYVRPIDRQGGSGYAVFSAEGELLAITVSRDSAFGLIREHDLEPVDAH